MTASGHKELNVLSLPLLEIVPKGCTSHLIQITYVISEYELFQGTAAFTEFCTVRWTFYFRFPGVEDGANALNSAVSKNPERLRLENASHKMSPALLNGLSEKAEIRATSSLLGQGPDSPAVAIFINLVFIVLKK